MDYELKRYPTNEAIASPPPLSDSVFAENENFWKEHDAQLRALLPAITTPASDKDMTARQRWMDAMHIPFEKNFEALNLGNLYSRALNTWGVQAQRIGKLEAAGAHFDEAVELYSDNVVARENSDFNKKLRAGQRVAMEDPSAFEQRFGKFSSWEQILIANGTFDEPTGCLAQGIVFARGRLDRQAAQYFERSLALAPDSLLARLWLARVYLILAVVDKDFGMKAFPLLDQLKARASSFSDAAISPFDVFQLELAANYVNGRPAAVRHLVNTAVSHDPPDDTMLNVTAQMATFYRDFTNALLVVDRQLQLAPNSVANLMNKGFLQIQLSNFDGAIPPLSTVISLQPTNSQAIYFRAAAYLAENKLDDAQRDLETLQKANPTASPIYRGLADVATRRNDTNAAVHYYQLALTNSVPNSPEARFEEDRIKKLKAGSP
jgi:tetratricopeptide (TPR) repeat protein